MPLCRGCTVDRRLHSTFERRTYDDLCAPGHGHHTARPRRRARPGCAPRQDRDLPAVPRPRCVRGACPARRRRGALARRAVLHLARRPYRLSPVRGAVAGGRARGAGSPAAGRQQYRRARCNHRRARCSPEHRSAPVQPAGASHGALDELCDRLPAPESPHAQQVAHGRQSGDGRRRAQHRRRVLRRRPRGGVRRTWT